MITMSNIYSISQNYVVRQQKDFNAFWKIKTEIKIFARLSIFME